MGDDLSQKKSLLLLSDSLCEHVPHVILKSACRCSWCPVNYPYTYFEEKKLKLIKLIFSPVSPAVKSSRFKLSWTLSLSRRNKQNKTEEKLQKTSQLSKSLEALSPFRVKTNSLKRAPTRT